MPILGDTIPRDVEVRRMAEMSGLQVPDRDLQPLAKLLANYLASTKVLLTEDYSGCVPATGAQWHE